MVGDSNIAANRRQTWAEVGLIFAVFLIQGAYPVPEVNEPYYLGRAIHFWNPDWIRGDFFLDTADAHQTFYFTFGWLSLILPPLTLAWVGRILTWGLLAWAWRRLSFTVVPRPWFSVLTAALLVTLTVNFHMAGEWLIGGVEAKGFAFVLVFLGLEALWRNQWNRVWLLFGAAAAFHVLVGGWSVVAAGMVWLAVKSKHGPEPGPATLFSMLPGLIGGALLSLPGLLPAIWLTWGIDAALTERANQIYVYHRLYHHLDPLSMPTIFIVRFAILSAAWGGLCFITPSITGTRRLRWFVAGSLVLSLMGFVAGLTADFSRPLAAGLLRLYWFRLADIAVPLGYALEVAVLIASLWESRPKLARYCLAATVFLSGIYLGPLALERPFPVVPPADQSIPHFPAWIEACQWIATSGEIPPNARFLTPRMNHTFKWYAERPEVANWKEIPQDAKAIVKWWDRIRKLHGMDPTETGESWYESLAEQDPARLEWLGAKYKADYLITIKQPHLPFDVVFENYAYCVYKLPKPRKVD